MASTEGEAAAFDQPGSGGPGPLSDSSGPSPLPTTRRRRKAGDMYNSGPTTRQRSAKKMSAGTRNLLSPRVTVIKRPTKSLGEEPEPVGDPPPEVAADAAPSPVPRPPDAEPLEPTPPDVPYKPDAPGAAPGPPPALDPGEEPPEPPPPPGLDPPGPTMSLEMSDRAWEYMLDGNGV